ncbi:MAG TPA: endoglucanase [Prevotellaceae bacterium]|nr:endoglucanase [Prevotellaceae bacterium]
MRQKIFLIICLLTFALQTQAERSYTKKIAATDSGISYTGRVCAGNDGSIAFDWSGTYLQTDFTGGGIAVEISDTQNDYFNVFIDDKFTKKIQVNSQKPIRIVLAEKLSKGFHRLRLQKCTEGNQGRTTIHGFYIADQGKTAPVKHKQRLIEVIGDSYTCGYGTEAGKEENFKVETENCDQAYGCIIARYFNADYVLVAHSGMGMSRNYGDKEMVSKNNMVERYLRVFDESSAPAYDFKAYHPDLVTINLGTNDYSTGKGPSPSTYADNYLKMIGQIREHYGDVPILCITPHSAQAPLLKSLEEVRTRIKDMDKVYMASAMPDIVDYDHDMGANWHPNYQGQRKIAMTLIPRISQIMGWPLEDKIVR